MSFRNRKQNWWELQQAQAAYEPHFGKLKLIWPHFQIRGSFLVERQPHYLNNKCFFFADANYGLAAFLNSRLAWFCLNSMARVKRGGYIEAEAQYVGALPAPSGGSQEILDSLGRSLSEDHGALGALSKAVRHRLADLNSSVSSSSILNDWFALSFADLQAEMAKRFKIAIPVAERDEWERWFEAQRVEAAALAGRIAATETEIDARVYRLFDLTPTEIAAIEDALRIASPALSLDSYEAISAVEGLALTDEARRRLVRQDGKRSLAA